MAGAAALAIVLAGAGCRSESEASPAQADGNGDSELAAPADGLSRERANSAPTLQKVSDDEAASRFDELPAGGAFGRPEKVPLLKDDQLKRLGAFQLVAYPDNRVPVHSNDYSEVVGFANAILRDVYQYSTVPVFDASGAQVGWQTWEYRYIDGHVTASDEEVQRLADEMNPFEGAHFDDEMKQCAVSECGSAQLTYLIEGDRVASMGMPVRS